MIVLLKKFMNSLTERTLDAEHQLIPYGVLGFFGFFLFYFFNSSRPDCYENIPLRLIAGILCFFLMLKNYWPERYKKFIPLYWNATILFNLPFFFTFMILKNPTDPVWPLYGTLALAVLILLVDWVSFFAITIIGVLLAVFIYNITTSSPKIPNNFSASLIVYCSIIIYFVLFSKNNQSAQKTKIQTMKMLAASIAHELRTPLSAITMNADALSRYFPFYQEAYRQAKEAKLPLAPLRSVELEKLDHIPQSLQTLSRNANTTINMLLCNLNDNFNNQTTEICSMQKCVEESLDEYPFSQHELELVECIYINDFSFFGHKELIKHVLFNLIKNAVYAIASAGKGKITITVKTSSVPHVHGQLVFKDSGTGISPEALPYIFDRFYTKSNNGTGIGLAFCQSVINGLRGKIICSSDLGEHTTFTISIPLVEKM